MILTIFAFLIYLQIILANDAYTCNKAMSTPFKTTKDFVNCMTRKSFFFDNYLKTVKGFFYKLLKIIPNVTGTLYHYPKTDDFMTAFLIRTFSSFYDTWQRI